MKTAVLVLMLAVGVLALPIKRAEFIPAQAEQYRARLVREAHAAGGLTAPIPMFAAQLHQESRWNPAATSGVGALGLAQFMPGTAAWIANLYPADLRPGTPLDAGWALRAVVRYDYWLYARLPAYTAGEERWAAALSSYNGGLGYAQKDARLTGCHAWFGCAELFNDGRTAANLKQNHDYPRRILLTLRPLYQQANW